MIQFWYLVNADGTPLPGQFPYTKLQAEIIAAQDGHKDTTASPIDGPPIHLSVIRPAAKNSVPFFVLYRTRQYNPSHMYDAGTMKPMPLHEGQRQEEGTYIKFLSRNVIGFLMHGDSPKPKRLTDYLSIRFGANYELRPIFRSDLDTAIRELTAQHVEITIPAEQAAHVAAGVPPGFANGLSALSQLMEDGAITLRLSPGRGGNALKRAKKRDELISLARGLIGWAKGSGVTRASLVGRAGQDQLSLDLLDKRFAYKISVPADEVVYDQTEIRDDTPMISQYWEAERGTLERLAPEIATATENEGLLGPFIEKGL